MDIQATYSYYQWITSPEDTDPQHSTAVTFHKINMLPFSRSTHQSIQTHINTFIEDHLVRPHQDPCTCNQRRLHEIWQQLSFSTSPIILTVDGGLTPTQPDQPYPIITANATLGILPDAPAPITQNSTWYTQPLKPLLSRTTYLPPYIGTAKTSINTAEIMATIPDLEILPPNTPRLLIQDLNTARNLYLYLLDPHPNTTPRQHTNTAAHQSTNTAQGRRPHDNHEERPCA